MVPDMAAGGMDDTPCLCTTLSANDRVILRGRADTLAWWERDGVNAEQVEQLRSTMVHLVAGCVGPCRGNSATHPVCVL